MSIILHIETATSICSVSLAKNGSLIEGTLKETNEQKSHAAELTVFIEEIVKNAGVQFSDIDAVAVSQGPGSYTGLRIGVSTAKGLCYGLSIPMIAISTIDMLAKGMKNAIEPQKNETNILFCPMVDARRMEVYTAMYNIDLQKVIPIEAEIFESQKYQKLLETHIIYFAGDGAKKCYEQLQHHNARLLPNVFCSSAYMSEMAYDKYIKKGFEDVAYFEPFYLKDFVAGVSKNSVLG